jgi:hypothetical protein
MNRILRSLFNQLTTFLMSVISGPSPAPDERPPQHSDDGKLCPTYFPPEVCYALGVVNTVDLELGEYLCGLVRGGVSHGDILEVAKIYKNKDQHGRYVVVCAVVDVLRWAGSGGYADHVLEHLLSALNIGTTHLGSMPLFSIYNEQGVFRVHGLTHVGAKPANRAQALVWSKTAHAYLLGGLQAAEDYLVEAEQDYDDSSAGGRHVMARLVDFETHLTSGHLGHFGMVRDERRMEVNRRIRARREQAAADQRVDGAVA